MKHFHVLHRARTLVALAVAAIAVGVGAAAYSATGPAITTFTPHSANQITNLDVLRQQIRNYYGDPLGTGTFDPNGNYAHEAEGVASDGSRYLAGDDHGPGQGRGPGGHGPGHTGHDSHGKSLRHATNNHGNAPGTVTQSGTKAIVLDVDDTTLATWNYEIASNWAYNPTTNASYVNGELFPAVPGMVAMVTQAQQEGYAIFFITGRPASQEAATLGNLTSSDNVGLDAGYPTPTTLTDGEDGLFTKPAVADYPSYLQTACAGDPGGSCTTVHYKSATRAHIESLGYDIVANFGDQYSDLLGGYADRTFKLPNPNYFLP